MTSLRERPKCQLKKSDYGRYKQSGSRARYSYEKVTNPSKLDEKDTHMRYDIRDQRNPEPVAANRGKEPQDVAQHL